MGTPNLFIVHILTLLAKIQCRQFPILFRTFNVCSSITVLLTDDLSAQRSILPLHLHSCVLFHLSPFSTMNNGTFPCPPANIMLCIKVYLGVFFGGKYFSRHFAL